MKTTAALAAAGIALSAAAIWADTGSALTARIDGPPGRSLAEADIAVNPLDPTQVIVVSKDENGDDIAILDAFHSTDGGASFSGGALVNGSYLGRPAAASDPVIVFDPAGTAYYGQLVWRNAGTAGFESLLGVQRSSDGGASFGTPVKIVSTINPLLPSDFGSPPAPSVTHDKEWLAVDDSPTSPHQGTVYAGWSRVRFVNRRGLQHNRIAVARSTDGGASFSPPVLVSSGRSGRRIALGPQLTVQPDGTVVIVWASLRRSEADRRGRIFTAASRDGGANFTYPRPIASFGHAPATHPLVALDAAESGALLACWPQRKRGRRPWGVCSRSNDEAHWSRPAPIAPRVKGMQDLVMVESQGENRFWVSLYAMRKDRLRVLLYRSDNGGRRFRLVRRLASRSIGFSRLGFIGDYSGLEATDDRIFAAYVLPRRGPLSRNSIYVESLAAP